MEALDGNAVAGAMYEVFGREMTTVTGTCRNCGARRVLAELRVYAKAPGTVARCPSCDSVLFVLVDVGGAPRVHLDALAVPEEAQPRAG